MGYLTGAGSDYAAFMHYLGISSMDIAYTYDRVRHLFLFNFSQLSDENELHLDFTLLLMDSLDLFMFLSILFSTKLGRLDPQTRPFWSF